MKKTTLLIGLCMIGAGLIYAQRANQKTNSQTDNKSAATAQAAQQDNSLEIGAQIPARDIDLQATDDKRYTLDQIKTRNGLLVMFSCNTCPYVIKSQKRTQEIMKLAKEKGIGMAIINSNTAQRDGGDSYEAMQQYARAQKYTVPYLRDEGQLVDAFRATRTPEVFLFNNEGVLVYKGAMEDNPSDPANSKKFYLNDAIASMVSGKPVGVNSTRSIGCSIKR